MTFVGVECETRPRRRRALACASRVHCTALGWHTCLSQKHATELLSTPSSARCCSSVAPAGSLITGAVCLNTFPPRSSTKWLCVATSPQVMVSGRRQRVRASSDATRTTACPRSRYVLSRNVWRRAEQLRASGHSSARRVIRSGSTSSVAAIREHGPAIWYRQYQSRTPSPADQARRARRRLDRVTCGRSQNASSSPVTAHEPDARDDVARRAVGRVRGDVADRGRHRASSDGSSSSLSLDVARPDEPVLLARTVDERLDRRPHHALRGVGGLTGLAADPVDDAQRRCDRRVDCDRTAEWSASRARGCRRRSHRSTVCTSTDGRNFSTSGAPNSRFMKLLPVILPTNPAQIAAVVAPDLGELEEPLHERHGQHVLAVARLRSASGRRRAVRCPAPRCTAGCPRPRGIRARGSASARRRPRSRRRARCSGSAGWRRTASSRRRSAAGRAGGCRRSRGAA